MESRFRLGLTKRWRERRTVVRSTFEVISTL